MTQAVSNAGPLIHLDQIGRLAVMAVFERVFIPDLVFAEATRAGRVEGQRLRALPNLNIVSVHAAEMAPLREATARFELQQGEVSALCLCRKLGMSLFLTDDLAARQAAKALGLEPHGSIGVLTHAYRANRLTLGQTKEAIQDLLNRSDLFLTPAIVEQAIAELERV